MYIMIPSNIFFFVLGVIVGFIVLIIILSILNNRMQKKNKENVEEFLKTFNIQKKDDK